MAFLAYTRSEVPLRGASSSDTLRRGYLYPLARFEVAFSELSNTWHFSCNCKNNPFEVLHLVAIFAKLNINHAGQRNLALPGLLWHTAKEARSLAEMGKERN
jgi:hypothetical protein